MTAINHLLDTHKEGDPAATDQLLVLVYSELRRLAAAKMSHEAPGQTLQPMAMVERALRARVPPCLLAVRKRVSGVGAEAADGILPCEAGRA